MRPVNSGVRRLLEPQIELTLRVKGDKFMNRVFNYPSMPISRAFVCLLLMLLVSVGCGQKGSSSSYEQQPFDSQKWRNGDAITRGTMIRDVHGKRTLSGQSKEGIVELLGEPDKKRSSDGLDVWLYQIEVRGEKPIRYFAVSFDRTGKASSGVAKDGTLSLTVDD